MALKLLQLRIDDWRLRIESTERGKHEKIGHFLSIYPHFHPQ